MEYGPRRVPVERGILMVCGDYMRGTREGPPGTREEVTMRDAGMFPDAEQIWVSRG